MGSTFVADVRYAVRLLRQAPGFAVAAVLTLAIGIGVNTTIFTAVDAMALHPRPVKGGDRLVRLERWFSSEARGDVQFAFSSEEYRYVGAQHAFAALVAVSAVAASAAPLWRATRVDPLIALRSC